MANKDNILVDTNKRLIYLSDDIEVNTISHVNFYLLSLLAEDDKQEEEKRDYERKPIHIFINSCGGEVWDMWSLIDIMITARTPIYTYCTGYALSAAFNIFLAGDKRFVFPHTTLLYHQMSNWNFNKYQDLVEFRPELDKMQKDIEEYVVARMSITLEKLEENRIHKKDWYIHDQEALQLGIATNIIV